MINKSDTAHSGAVRILWKCSMSIRTMADSACQNTCQAEPVEPSNSASAITLYLFNRVYPLRMINKSDTAHVGGSTVSVEGQCVYPYNGRLSLSKHMSACACRSLGFRAVNREMGLCSYFKGIRETVRLRSIGSPRPFIASEHPRNLSDGSICFTPPTAFYLYRRRKAVSEEISWYNGYAF